MKLAIAIVLASVAANGAAAHAACRDADPFDTTVIHDRLATLASPELDGRAPGTDGDAAARAIIAERFACAGLVPAGDNGTFEQAFTAQNGKPTANLIGVLPGTEVDGDIIIVTAHHDHLGDHHLGANDDASGIVGLLAIAQAMTAQRRTIVFAAFGDEEDGMIGSTFFAAHMPAAIAMARVVEVVELDMIGSHDSSGLVGAMGTFAKLPARVLLDKLARTFHRINVVPGGHARGSDFLPFCAAGVPFTFFWTPDRRCYHETCDTIERIDMPHLIDIAKLANELVAALASTELDLATAKRVHGCGQGMTSKGAR